MAKLSSFITLSIFTLLLCRGSVAQFGFGGQSPWHSSRGFAGGRECRFESLDALQPTQHVQHEAGRTEYYDETNQMFRCAGISAQRHIINPRGLLLPSYSNAPSLIPFWNVNAHSVMYVTGGQGRVQVVNNRGKTVFDGQLRRGQILVIPQNYAVLKRAHMQGFEWVSFKTNPNAMVNKIAGKLSTLRSVPLDVIMNSYRITREQARRLKNSRREEMSIFTPLFRSQREIEYEQAGRDPQYEKEGGQFENDLE